MLSLQASLPQRAVRLQQYPQLAQWTSLGWTKDLSPRAVLLAFDQVIALNFPYEDFVNMALLHRCPILSFKTPVYRHLRRGHSLCGQRKVDNLTRYVPGQLARFALVLTTVGTFDAQEIGSSWIQAKLDQYRKLTEELVNNPQYPHINSNTPDTIPRARDPVGIL